VFTSTKTVLCSLFLFLLSFEVHSCSASFRSLCRVVILINLLALSDKNVESGGIVGGEACITVPTIAS
jgi:hypothetical protein